MKTSVLGLVLVSLAVLQAIPLVHASTSSTSPKVDEIMKAIADAVSYINRLTRYAGTIPVVSEYPALPVIATAWNGMVSQQIHFIPGLKLKYGHVETWVEISLVNETSAITYAPFTTKQQILVEHPVLHLCI